MALQYPYSKITVADGVDNVLAVQHNHQEDQIDEITNIVYRHDNQICVGVRPGEINPSQVGVDVLTTRILDTAKTLKFKIGASNFTDFTATNVAGPAGTGLSVFIQRFTVPTALLMGALTGAGQKTAVKLVLYEDSEPVGWIDVMVVIP
jgi:hypothetical protein